ncbi:hypothetical protein DCCM_4507 [Desulfocucumis palustris]|uniref:Uncharacterized protein n=1 Tax=Desulfocucumis palustris TaxID=1898651 RepID=A0A2L2XHC1_9FIRM|nr:hypothetical protein DCCM_4507 [Desulfocucumis palustris]
MFVNDIYMCVKSDSMYAVVMNFTTRYYQNIAKGLCDIKQ